jgi:chromosome segregation ATPase
MLEGTHGNWRLVMGSEMELPPLEITEEDRVAGQIKFNDATLEAWKRKDSGVEFMAAVRLSQEMSCRERQLRESQAELRKLRAELENWKRRYYEMEGAQSRSIDRAGELMRTIQDREADRSREQELKNKFRDALESERKARTEAEERLREMEQRVEELDKASKRYFEAALSARQKDGE